MVKYCKYKRMELQPYVTQHFQICFLFFSPFIKSVAFLRDLVVSPCLSWSKQLYSAAILYMTQVALCSSFLFTWKGHLQFGFIDSFQIRSHKALSSDSKIPTCHGVIQPSILTYPHHANHSTTTSPTWEENIIITCLKLLHIIT